ncbi:hypothetical protein WIW50_14920 [Flavobacteriaceae bacterium 3-367]|uniref:hypothetical protein n=1 Tax=Eudoraea algarum TaxID=3417568 RepID=UPI00329466C8
MKERSFPYKTLIWAVVALAALFLFKTEVKGLLVNSSEVNIFGVHIKVSEKESKNLLLAQEAFEDEVAVFNQQIASQDATISSLNELVGTLRGEIDGCTEAEGTALKLNAQIMDLNTMNRTIKNEKILSKDYKIIQAQKSNLK